MYTVLIAVAVLFAAMLLAGAAAALVLYDRSRPTAVTPARRLSTFAEEDTIRFLVTGPVEGVRSARGLASIPEMVSKALQLDLSKVDVVVQVDQERGTGEAYLALPSEPVPAPAPTPAPRPDDERGNPWDKRVALFGGYDGGQGRPVGAHRYGSGEYRPRSWTPLAAHVRDFLAPTYYAWHNGRLIGEQIVREAVAAVGGRL